MHIDMQTKLLAQLELIGDANLPAWTDVITVKQSADELQAVIESVLRGKLLLEILNRLPPEAAWLGYDDDHSRIVNTRSPYAPCFLEDVNVCLRMHPNVAVCFGMGSSSDPTNGAWLGYMRLGDPTGQQTIHDKVYAEANEREQKSDDAGWYRFQHWHPDYENRFVEEQASTIVGRLIDMRDGLAARLMT